MRERHFCADCVPRVRTNDTELLAACGVLVLGILAAVWNLGVGVVLVTIGGVRVVLRLLSGGTVSRARDRPALFLDPRVGKLALEETLTGSASDGSRGRVRTVQGRIDAELVWSRAHVDRVREYRRRQRIRPDQAVGIVAGGLVLRGPARVALCLDREFARVLPQIDDLALQLRPRDVDHPVLAAPDDHGDPRWKFEIAYDVTEPHAGEAMPVWVTAAIAPQSDARALELHVHWRMREPGVFTLLEGKSPLPKKVEELQLSVPAAWGGVEAVSEQRHVTITQGSGRTSVVWRKPELDLEASALGRCHFSVAFQHRIDDRRLCALPVVEGSLVMLLDGAVSGTERVQIHAAGGALRGDRPRKGPRTRVEVDFRFDLTHARYQDVRSVPDPARDADAAQPPREHRTFHGVVPDHRTVALLTTVLSEAGYYVKRVVENPPQAGRSARVLDRFWDIAGRRYEGVRAVDFRLVLTGEEALPGSPTTPSTTIRITVRGAFANEDMEQRIVAEHDELWMRVNACLSEAGAGVEADAPRSSAEPIDATRAEVAKLRNVALTLRRRVESGHRRGDVSNALATDVIRTLDKQFQLPRSEPLL